MNKITTSQLQGVPATMLLTLYWRAAEMDQPEPLIKDEVAADLIKRIDYDASRVGQAKDDQLFNVLRVRQFDRYAREFMAANPHGTIVDLGCGLDARIQRIGKGTIRWFGLDLPEVIAFRKQWIKDPPQYRLIAKSVLDFTWMDQVASSARDGYHFSAQGLFPYLPTEDVRNLVLALYDRFPGCELVFDGMSPFMLWLHNMHPAMRTQHITLRWAIKNNHEMETWREGIRLTGHWDYWEDDEPRIQQYKWMKLIPGGKDGNKILRYKLGG